MKNCRSPLLTLLVLVVLGGQASPQSTSPFKWVSPFPQGTTLNRVYFLNESQGWIVGNFGTILRTTDGGATWSNVQSGAEFDLHAIAFASEKDGWIVGDNGIMLVTANGGETWEPGSSPVTTELRDVQFQNPQTGIAVGEFGIVLRTTDGGRHWGFIRRADDCDYNRIVLDKQQAGIIVASDGRIGTVDRHGPVTFGGKKHSSSPLIDATVAPDGSVFWAVGAGGELLESRDRDRWSDVEVPDGLTPTIVCAADAGTLLLGDNDGNIRLYNAQAEQWLDVFSSNKNALFTSIAMGDKFTAFAVGKSGIILRMDLGTRKASVITEYRLPAVRSVVFLDEDNAVAMAANGSVVATTNGGVSWREIPLSGHEIPRPAEEISWMRERLLTSRGTVKQKEEAAPVLLSGDIIRDPSGAALIARENTLSTVSIPPTRVDATIFVHISGRLRKLGVMGDSSIVFISDLGEVGTIRTGDTTPRLIPVRLDVAGLRAIGGGNRSHIIAVGLQGSIYRWDGGRNVWNESRLPTSNLLTSLRFVDPRHGFIGTAAGQIYATADGGETWTEVPRATLTAITDIQPSPLSTTLWAVGADGTLLTSNDGGKFWKAKYLPLKEYIRSVQFLPPDLLYVFGGGSILRVSSLELHDVEK